MARIFNINFSLRKVALVVFETILLTAVILPISNMTEFLRIIHGEPTGVKFVNDQPAGISIAVSLLVLRVLFIVFVCQICFFLNDLYNWKITANRSKTYLRLLESVSYAMVLIALAYYCFDGLGKSGFQIRGLDIRLGIVNVPNALACMAVIYAVSYYYRILFHWTLFTWKLADRLLMVGITPMTDLIVKELKDREDPGYEITGYVVKDPAKEVPNRRILGGYDEPIYNIVTKYNINRIIVSVPEQGTDLPINELLNCRVKGIYIDEASIFYERLTGKVAIEKLHPSNLIFSEGFVQFKFNYILKRIMDLGLAVIGLFLALPIIAITALCIKLDSRGPVFHRQKRVGKQGKIFTLTKFRSMYVDAEKATGPVWATKDDARVTRVGRIIRKLRVDEIPQMWNVLRNEMSFVGPRPERPYFVEELKKEIPYFTERLVVKPGITGWAQINYSYGASRKDALQKLQYDLYYIKNMSVFLDIIIVLRTIKVIVRRQGAV